jgi:hypothetical protein
LQPLKTGNQNLFSTSTTSQVGRTHSCIHFSCAVKNGRQFSYFFRSLLTTRRCVKTAFVIFFDRGFAHFSQQLTLLDIAQRIGDDSHDLKQTCSNDEHFVPAAHVSRVFKLFDHR